VNLRKGTPAKLQAPVESLDLSEAEEAMLDHVLSCRAVGSPATVKQKVDAFLARTKADELIMTGQIFEHAARLRSYELLAQIYPSKR
jgi:alkanesulfonate monooxygenase SsuD/methylene tetrahydromethanopterin reductase-like flavin-dependent oxidoreductase (luciferase family)